MKKSVTKLITYWELNKTYLPLTAQQWAELEDAIQHQILPLTRGQIEAVTTLFKISGPAGKQRTTWRRIESELGSWRKHTVKLRHKIGMPPSTAEDRLSRASLQKRYSRFELPHDAILHLTYLDAALRLALDTTNYIANEINRTSVETRDDEMWFVWAVIIEGALRQSGIRTTAGSGDKQHRDSPFVLFVQKLQAFLPVSCRKRQSVGSIAKGIQLARAKFGHMGPRALLFILVGCGIGARKFPLGPLDSVTSSIMAANRILSSLYRSKNRERRERK
jgi:hypothetical protein